MTALKFKKYFFVFIAAIMIAAGLISAAKAEVTEPVFDTVRVHLYNGDARRPRIQSLTFNLLDGDTGALLDSKTADISDEINCYDLTFAVPEFQIGKGFIFHMSQGDAELDYNGQTGAYFVINTYSYPDEQGNYTLYSTDFYMTLHPAADRTCELRLDGELRADIAVYPYPEGILIPVQALSALGIESSHTDDGGLLLRSGEQALLLYRDQLCAYKNAAAFNLALAPTAINGADFVPVGDTAAVFNCPVEYSDDGQDLRLALGRSPYAASPEERRINAAGVSSDTNYLIWISKSEYTVRVFKGSAGDWRLVKSFKCAIGAPSTPTVTGTFKYYANQERWSYAQYWCGPIMRFRSGGYAMHSTLRRYDGGDYDGRVGAAISHGCVRIRPENIEWMFNTIPLQTTVYITK